MVHPQEGRKKTITSGREAIAPSREAIAPIKDITLRPAIDLKNLLKSGCKLRRTISVNSAWAAWRHTRRSIV